MAVNGCPVCLAKQRRIDELEEEVKRLQAKLRYEERKEQDGFFGSSTPSSKRPIKPNSGQKEKKPKGERGSVIKELVEGATKTAPLIGLRKWVPRARLARSAELLWRKKGGQNAVLWTLPPRSLKRSRFV